MIATLRFDQRVSVGIVNAPSGLLADRFAAPVLHLYT